VLGLVLAEIADINENRPVIKDRELNANNTRKIGANKPSEPIARFKLWRIGY